jgi:hypothetical protein
MMAYLEVDDDDIENWIFLRVVIGYILNCQIRKEVISSCRPEHTKY